MTFEIHSFEGALPLRFGMSPAEVSAILGTPRVAAPNWQGTLRYSYDSPPLNLNIIFGGDGKTADHFGFGRLATVHFRGVDFFSDRSAWRSLLDYSSDYHVCSGLLVFCDLGIALSGFHDGYEDELAVTVFPRDAWEKFRSKFKPYKLSATPDSWLPHTRP